MDYPVYGIGMGMGMLIKIVLDCDVHQAYAFLSLHSLRIAPMILIDHKSHPLIKRYALYTNNVVSRGSAERTQTNQSIHHAILLIFAVTSSNFVFLLEKESHSEAIYTFVAYEERERERERERVQRIRRLLLLLLLLTMKLIPHKFTAISLFLAARSSYGFSLLRIQSGPSSTAVLSSSTDHQSDDIDVEENVSSFSDLGIEENVLEAIWSRPDWLHPTPVQQLAIPRLLEGDDRIDSSSDAFWCEAPTGSGKTITYLIPLIQNLLMRRKQRQQQQQQKGEDKERITALILVPTRELCIQIGCVLDQLVDDIPQPQQRKLSTMVLHGGTLLTPQIVRLADCAQYKTTIDVIVATPGRLIDVITSYAQDGGNHHAKDAAMERRLLQALDDQPDDDLSLEQLQKLGLDSVSHDGDNDDDDDDFDSSDGRNELINVLGGLQYLVLDEADRLLGNGFRGELDSVLDLVSSKPTTWLFSATLPKSIEPRLDNVLSSIGATNSPVRLVCANSDRKLSEDAPVSSSLQKKLQHSSTVSSASQYQQVGPASTINLRTIRMEKSARTQVLRKLLQQDYKDDWDRVLVFVSTRYASEHVSKKLRRAGISSSELHGKLDQDARLRRLDDLKKGKIRVLLCTDVASRGIDISGLPAVVNYDLPRSTSDFVHRIGRTGRAGKQGTAVSFVTPAVEGHMDLIEKRHLETPPEREILPGFEPNEERWTVEAAGTKISVPGVEHSSKGLVHDKMFGGIKGRRKTKKDKIRESAARDASS